MLKLREVSTVRTSVENTSTGQLPIGDAYLFSDVTSLFLTRARRGFVRR